MRCKEIKSQNLKKTIPLSNDLRVYVYLRVLSCMSFSLVAYNNNNRQIYSVFYAKAATCHKYFIKIISIVLPPGTSSNDHVQCLFAIYNDDL